METNMHNEALFIPILVGTTRSERQTIHVARVVEEVGREIPEIEVELVDPINYIFPEDGNDPSGKDPRYSALSARADGFMIVTPEYNHSFPGSLKRMLDSELENYIHKPAGFISLSSGQWGGVRAIEALVPSVREMGMVTSFSDVNFPKVASLFDANARLTNDHYRDYVRGAFTELIWLASVMKWGRDHISSKYHTTHRASEGCWGKTGA
ncbi:MAG: NADPH-dependent FMN reductase [Candidatus Saccharimonadia bacterium]